MLGLNLIVIKNINVLKYKFTKKYEFKYSYNKKDIFCFEPLTLSLKSKETNYV